MSPTSGNCSEKERLFSDYQTATADYAGALMLLAERTGVMSKADYIAVREYSETARAKAEAARDALGRHVAEHGC